MATNTARRIDVLLIVFLHIKHTEINIMPLIKQLPRRRNH
jgi:hypothetical protein